MSCPAKTERNAALFRDYLAGDLRREEIAVKYGISVFSMNRLLQRHGVRLSPEERFRRAVCNLVHGKGGRPRAWPDCPAELADDYALLRRKGCRAAEARAMLDPGFQA